MSTKDSSKEIEQQITDFHRLIDPIMDGPIALHARAALDTMRRVLEMAIVQHCEKHGLDAATGWGGARDAGDRRYVIEHLLDSLVNDVVLYGEVEWHMSAKAQKAAEKKRAADERKAKIR